MIKFQLGNVLEFAVENNIMIGVIISFSVTSDGTSYTIKHGDQEYVVEEKDIIKRYVPVRVKSKKVVEDE